MYEIMNILPISCQIKDVTYLLGHYVDRIGLPVKHLLLHLEFFIYSTCFEWQNH